MDTSLAIHIPSSIGADKAVSLVRSAEEGGIDRVWLSEDLFFHGAMPTAGAVAVATRRIGIGFGVLTPYIRHPSLLAMETASLLDIAGPRVTLGIGAGVKARVDRTEIAYRSPLTAVRETTDIVRRMLAGEEITKTGDLYGGDRLSLDIDCAWPVPPIYLASTGPRSLRQTGSIGDGLVLTIMSSTRHASWATGEANRAADEAGRPTPLPTVVYLPLSVDDDPQQARDRLKPVVAYFLTRWAEIPPLAALFTDWGPYTPDRLAADVSRLRNGESPHQVVTDSLVDEYCVAGTPTQCLDRLAAYADCGVTEVALDGGHHGADLIGLIQETQLVLSAR